MGFGEPLLEAAALFCPLLGLVVGLLASVTLQANRALRLGQLQRLQERLTPLPE